MLNECTIVQAQDQAALYALGMLEPDLAAEFEQHLESCVGCRGEVLAFTETAAQLALTATHEPPPRLRDRVLSLPPDRSKRIFIQRAADGSWLDSPFPGVGSKPLFHDPMTGLLTQLVRLRPGAYYPSHRHSAAESCYVLEGDVQIGPDTFGAGDFTLAPAGTLHGMVSSRGGCVLLITSNPHDEVVA